MIRPPRILGYPVVADPKSRGFIRLREGCVYADPSLPLTAIARMISRLPRITR